MSAAKSNNTNRYAPPLAIGKDDAASETPSTLAKRIRKQRQPDEESLKQNTLCLVAMFVLLATVANLGILGLLGNQSTIVGYAIAIVSTTAALAGLVVNWGVRRFASWTRVPLTILAVLGLPLAPIGTVFGGLLLRAIHGHGGPKLLSREYEELVKATPEMNERTSKMTWVVVALLMVIAALIIFGP